MVEKPALRDEAGGGVYRSVVGEEGGGGGRKDWRRGGPSAAETEGWRRKAPCAAGEGRRLDMAEGLSVSREESGFAGQRDRLRHSTRSDRGDDVRENRAGDTRQVGENRPVTRDKAEKTGPLIRDKAEKTGPVTRDEAPYRRAVASRQGGGLEAGTGGSWGVAETARDGKREGTRRLQGGAGKGY